MTFQFVSSFSTLYFKRSKTVAIAVFDGKKCTIAGEINSTLIVLISLPIFMHNKSIFFHIFGNVIERNR